MIIGVSGLFYGLMFTPVLIVAFGFLVNLFERGYTSLAYAYSPELFDTDARSLGTGLLRVVRVTRGAGLGVGHRSSSVVGSVIRSVVGSLIGSLIRSRG